MPQLAIVAGVLIVVCRQPVYGREREKDYLNGRYRADTVPDQIPNGIPEAMGTTNALHRPADRARRHRGRLQAVPVLRP